MLSTGPTPSSFEPFFKNIFLNIFFPFLYFRAYRGIFKYHKSFLSKISSFVKILHTRGFETFRVYKQYRKKSDRGQTVLLKYL